MSTPVQDVVIVQYVANVHVKRLKNNIESCVLSCREGGKVRKTPISVKLIKTKNDIHKEA